MNWIALVMISVFLWGCATGPTNGELVSGISPQEFDPQMLVGRWEGQWRWTGQAGYTATGEIKLTVDSVSNDEVVGTLNVTNPLSQSEYLGRDLEMRATIRRDGSIEYRAEPISGVLRFRKGKLLGCITGRHGTAPVTLLKKAD